MKILHTADWHLGKRLDRFERLPEQREVLAEICEIAEREEVDLVLVAGDLYDTFNPPNDAADVFYKMLRRLTADGKRPVIAIAGNHDSPDRIEAPNPLARACGILFAGYPHSEVGDLTLETGVSVIRTDHGFVELQLPQLAYPVRVLLTPYANEVRMRKDLGGVDKEAAMRDLLQTHWTDLVDRYCDDKGVNLATAHLFMIKKGEKPPEEHDDERPINVGGAQVVHTQNVPEGIQYMALGHIHGFRNMPGGPCPCVYSGSPLGYSFAEAGQRKGVVIVDVEPGSEAKYRRVELEKGRNLVRGKFEDIDEAVQWLNAHAEDYVELYIRSDTYISTEDRKRLVEAHERMVGPIPEFTSEAVFEQTGKREIDLSRSMEEIFADYFKHARGQAPSDELMGLFKEVLGTEDEG